MTIYHEALGLTGSADVTATEQVTVNQAMSIFGAAGLFPGGGITLEELLMLTANAGLQLDLVGDFIPSPCRYYYVAFENRTLFVTC